MAEKHEAAEREAAVSDVLQTMGRSSFDLQGVLDTVLANAVALCHADTGNIVRHDPSLDVYRIAAILGFEPGYREAEEAVDYVADRGSLTGRVLLERRPVHILDADEDPKIASTTCRSSAAIAPCWGRRCSGKVSRLA